jgi:tight adherence protein B
VSDPSGLGLLLLAAAAGGLSALAGRELVIGTPAAARWLERALEPLRRAAREGYSPSRPERRRLAALGTAAAALVGLALVGPLPAAALALAGPGLAGWSLARGRTRYRRAVERALPEIANAVADSLGAGHSIRAALIAAPGSLDGPARVELSRIAAELDLGNATGGVLAGLRERIRSPRVDAFCAALMTQQLAGGDLSSLLRSFALGAAERDRAADDARAATAQARFTGLLVVAMPAGAALLAELLEPGFFAKLLSSPPAATLLATAAALQLAGFAAIRRLSEVAE